MVAFIALEFLQKGGYKSRKLTHFLQIIIRKWSADLMAPTSDVEIGQQRYKLD